MLNTLVNVFNATIGRNDSWPLALVIVGIMAVSFWFGLQILKHEDAIDYGIAVCWELTKIIGWHLGYSLVTAIRVINKFIKALGNVKQTVTQSRQLGDTQFAKD